MVLGRAAQQNGTKQWPRCQPERSMGLCMRQATQLRFAIGIGGAFHLQHRQGPDGGRRLYDLHRLAAAAFKAGAQRLMPASDLAQCFTQCRYVQHPPQAQRRRDVVKRTVALHLVQEPDPMLGKRQRQRCRALKARNRCQPGALQLPQTRGQHLGQAPDGRRFKQRAQCYLAAQCRANA